MDFSHDEIEKRNLIEEYLLGRLSEEEETALEEHMLQCAGCREKCLQTEQVIDLLKSSETEEKTVQASVAAKGRIGWLSISLRIAAVFVLFAGIAVLYLKTREQSRLISSRISRTAIDTLIITPDETIKPDSAGRKVYESSGHDRALATNADDQDMAATPKDEMIAMAYRPSLVFEQAIQNNVRGSVIKIIAPADSAVVSFGVPVVFSWENPEDKKTVLLVRKNTGKVVFKQFVMPPYTFKVETPGLYYWQLVADDQVMHTGKFFVNQ